MSEYKIDAGEDYWPIYIDGFKVKNDVVICRLERQDQEIDWLKLVIKNREDSPKSAPVGKIGILIIILGAAVTVECAIHLLINYGVI